MTALVLALLLAEFAIAAVFAVLSWRLSGEVERLKSRHGKRAADDTPPARPARADTVPVPVVRTSLIAPVPVPAGRHAQALPRRSASRADLPVHPVETPDTAPWDTVTAQQAAVTCEDEEMRREYIASRLREAGTLTPEVMREAMRQPAYGEKPVATVLESERLAKGLIA